MDGGVSYTYSAAAYPRFRYFQRGLRRLFPRWQSILDAGGFSSCVSQGSLILNGIISSAQHIGGKVKVNLFGSEALLETLELAVQTNESIIGGIQTSEITWDSFVHEKKKTFEPCITVISIQSLQDENVKALENKLSHLSKADRHNIVIFIEESKTNFTYPVLTKSGFNLKEAAEMSDGDDLDLSKSIRKRIQYLLEKKAIAVLEDIAEFNSKFIPKKPNDLPESLQNAVQRKLKRSLCNPHIVKDLSPFGKGTSDDIHRKPTDSELFRISGAVKSDWETLGPSFGIPQDRIKEIQQSNQTLHSKVHNMLLLWRQKDDANLKYLLEVMKNIMMVINVDKEVIEEIENETMVLKTPSEVNKVFHQKLQDFVAKTTKCMACDKLSQQYGISSTLINEFLNEGFYGYERKVGEMISKLTLPSWTRDESDDGLSTCKAFLTEVLPDITVVVEEIEKLIGDKNEILTILKKLQFELFGLLQQTNVAIEIEIPEIPKLPHALQYALLQIPEIYGCGTVWGVLELHLTSDLSSKGQQDVKDLLSQYRYWHGYRTQLIEKPSTQVREDIEQGTALWAERTQPDEDEKYKLGSIGCFILVKPSGTSNTQNTTKHELHCITCAHCLTDCKADIQVYNRYRHTLEILGCKAYEIYERQALDVATIKIPLHQQRNCIYSLKNSEEWPCTWKFYDGPVIRKSVYKYGSVSALTHGICICTDWKTKQNFINWNSINNKTNFHPDYNILIGPPVGSQPNRSVEGIQAAASNLPMETEDELIGFSQEGDSGSVICNDNINTGEVVVISLLCGDIRQKINKRFMYSYSTNIQKVKRELEAKYNCVIEPVSTNDFTCIHFASPVALIQAT